MKRFLILFLSLISLIELVAQNTFDVEELEVTFLEYLDELRLKHKLSEFSSNEILDAIAFDQAEYILKTGVLSHTQTNKKKEKLPDRILFYEGLFSQAGENIAQIGLNSKVVLELGQSKKTADSPQKMLQGALNSWLEEKEGRLNLLDPNFSLCGISILENDKHELIIVLVAASEPFESPQGEKLSFNNYGIGSYSKEVCEPFLSEHGSLSQLFSDGFKIENGKLKFQFNSLAFWNEIINEGKDGLAVELVSREQFDCEATNRLFPGDVANGVLLKPYYKSKLSSLNTAEIEKRVDFDLGELPSFYDDANYEINGMIIKDGKKCASIPFNQIKTENVRWLNIPFQMSKPNLDSSLVGLDTIRIEFPLNMMDFELMNLHGLIHRLNYRLANMDVKVKVAPASGMREQEITSKFEDKIGSFLDENSMASYSIEENWTAYEEFKKGTFYQLETKDLSKEEEIAYLQKTVQTDKELAAALSRMTTFEVLLAGKYDLNKALSYEDRVTLLGLLVKKNKVELALHVQNELINQAVNGDKELRLLVTGDQQQLRNTLPLINNQIIAQNYLGEKQFDGNPLHIAYLELYLINPNNAVVSYNYHLAQLHYWSESVDNITEIDKWKKGFEKLKIAKEISKESYAKAYLNYLIISADYYYEKAAFTKRKKAFDEMLKYISSAKLNDKELLEVAKYLCYQDQFPRAIKMLLPEVKKEKVGENLLHYFLQIAIYDTYQVNEELYFSLLKKAQTLYPNSFCKLFSKERMGIQQLIKPRIKELYCEQCKQ